MDFTDEPEKQLPKKFIMLFMEEWVKTELSYVGNLRISETIISKQSWKRAGTRFLSRGIDDDGM